MKAARVMRQQATSTRLAAWLLALACLPGVHTQSIAQTQIAQPQALNVLDLRALLERVQNAAAQLDYAGTFTWQQGSELQSSRIVHVVDATGERERIEVLDGAAREFIRHNDVVQCLVPERKQVLTDQRRGNRFPALQLVLSQNAPNRQLSELMRRYAFTRMPPRQRVAGRVCTQIDVRPKDALRHHQRLCVDDRSGLLLRVQTLNPHGQVIEQIAFTSLQVGQNVWQEPLSPSWETHDWQQVQLEQETMDAARLGWRLPLPAGFKYVEQSQRPRRSGTPMLHVVMADGLSAISIFIEPIAQNVAAHTAPHTLSSAGAMHLHGVRVEDYRVTLVGDVPLATLKTLAGRVRYTAPAEPPATDSVK